jgi:hypothetical protein
VNDLACTMNNHFYSSAELGGGADGRRCELDGSELVPVPGSGVRPVERRSSTTPPMAEDKTSSAPTHSLTQALRLQFSGKAIVLRRGEETALGRDEQFCTEADFFARYDNVSRRHARCGLDQDGTAWIEDLYSTNQTKVDGTPLTPGRRQKLANGASVRLCVSLKATIELLQEEPDEC